jgi:hypothetical protein
MEEDCGGGQGITKDCGAKGRRRRRRRRRRNNIGKNFTRMTDEHCSFETSHKNEEYNEASSCVEIVTSLGQCPSVDSKTCPTKLQAPQKNTKTVAKRQVDAIKLISDAIAAMSQANADNLTHSNLFFRVYTN